MPCILDTLLPTHAQKDPHTSLEAQVFRHKAKRQKIFPIDPEIKPNQAMPMKYYVSKLNLQQFTQKSKFNEKILTTPDHFGLRWPLKLKTVNHSDTSECSILVQDSKQFGFISSMLVRKDWNTGKKQEKQIKFITGDFHFQ